MFSTKKIALAVIFLLTVLTVSKTLYGQQIDQKQLKSMMAILTNGSWQWQDRECDQTNEVFTFDASRNQMIIKGSYLSSKTNQYVAYESVYEILYTFKGGFRSRIIGEQRLDKNGNPVEWDLLLTGNSVFYWRRSDWSKYGRTKGNRLCQST